MKYLLLVCWGTDVMDAQTEPGPGDETEDESFPWLDDVQARGVWVTGDQIAPPRRARSIRVRDGKTLVTDGPVRRDEGSGRRLRHHRVRKPRRGRRDRSRASGGGDRDDRGAALLGELTGRMLLAVKRRLGSRM
jgi:hypothetical protein